MTERRRGKARIDYPATLSPTIGDIREAAGFYYSEGHVTVRANQLAVIIGQNDKEKLEWFQARFGGKVYGPYLIKVNGNLTHNVTLVRERALGFMFTVFTFLPQDRREQFKAALSGQPQARIYRQAFTPLGVDEAYMSRQLKQLYNKRKSNRRNNAMSIFTRRFEK